MAVSVTHSKVMYEIRCVAGTLQQLCIAMEKLQLLDSAQMAIAQQVQLNAMAAWKSCALFSSLASWLRVHLAELDLSLPQLHIGSGADPWWSPTSWSRSLPGLALCLGLLTFVPVYHLTFGLCTCICCAPCVWPRSGFALLLCHLRPVVLYELGLALLCIAVLHFFLRYASGSSQCSLHFAWNTCSRPRIRWTMASSSKKDGEVSTQDSYFPLFSGQPAEYEEWWKRIHTYYTRRWCWRREMVKPVPTSSDLFKERLGDLHSTWMTARRRSPFSSSSSSLSLEYVALIWQCRLCRVMTCGSVSNMANSFSLLGGCHAQDMQQLREEDVKGSGECFGKANKRLLKLEAGLPAQNHVATH